MSNLDQIINLAQQVSTPLGLDVLDAYFSQTGKQRCLRITIYRKGGSIGLSDCEQVSRDLEGLLDNLDPPIVAGNYLLEIESPGLDRKLKSSKDFQVFCGQSVELITKENLESLGNHFVGELGKSTDAEITIKNPQPIKDKSVSKKAHKNPKKTHKEFTQLPSELKLALTSVSQIKLFAEANINKENQ